MMRVASMVAVVSLSLAMQFAGGCGSPTAQFDALRAASSEAVAGTNTVEVLE